MYILTSENQTFYQHGSEARPSQCHLSSLEGIVFKWKLNKKIKANIKYDNGKMNQNWAPSKLNTGFGKI